MERTPSCAARSACVQPREIRHAESFIAPVGLEILNSESRRPVEIYPNDRNGCEDHTRLVDRNWYLQEWLEHFGKRQASLVNELGWDKSRANFVYHGKQPYRRDVVNEVAEWLGIEPFELLMPPEEALAIRSFRAAARTIAASAGSPTAPDRKAAPPERPRSQRPASPLARAPKVAAKKSA